MGFLWLSSAASQGDVEGQGWCLKPDCTAALGAAFLVSLENPGSPGHLGAESGGLQVIIPERSQAGASYWQPFSRQVTAPAQGQEANFPSITSLSPVGTCTYKPWCSGPASTDGNFLLLTGSSYCPSFQLLFPTFPHLPLPGQREDFTASAPGGLPFLSCTQDLFSC